MNLEILSKEEWASLSESAHRLAFDSFRCAGMDRVDFALLAQEDNVPWGYITIHENNAKSVYWQYGGAFPGTRGSSKVYVAYKAAFDWTMERYSRIYTLIENTNVAMLKLAMKVGFRIMGVRHVDGHTYVELIAVKV